MTLAEFLTQARERRGLTLRQLQDKADNLDHAYISRLEKGDKDKPSESTVKKLSKALQLNERERQIFTLLAEREIDDVLFTVMTSRPDIAWSHLEPVATMSFRGQRPTTEGDWLRMIKLIQEL
ncbi:MAG: helix-turn-helix transcriptional regulator [Sedimenticola sp.]